MRSGWSIANATCSSTLIGTFTVPVPDTFTAPMAGAFTAPMPDDPWEANTLEWATSSPPPVHNFDSLPPIHSDRPVYDLRMANKEVGA